jgi:hypothetical protein
VATAAVAHWKQDSVSWLRVVVVSLIVLNLLDAIFTLVWVEAGIAKEANLLLEGILSHSAIGFMLVKMALVSLGVLLLWRHRDRPLAVAGLGVACFAYNSLFVYHLGIAVAAVEFA